MAELGEVLLELDAQVVLALRFQGLQFPSFVGVLTHSSLHLELGSKKVNKARALIKAEWVPPPRRAHLGNVVSCGCLEIVLDVVEDAIGAGLVGLLPRRQRAMPSTLIKSQREVALVRVVAQEELGELLPVIPRLSFHRNSSAVGTSKRSLRIEAAP